MLFGVLLWSDKEVNLMDNKRFIRATGKGNLKVKPDVTRTEGLLLTAELSRLGPCLVARPARCGSDRQGTDATLLRLRLTARGLDVRFA